MLSGGRVYRFVGFAQDGKILAFEVDQYQQIEHLVDLKTGKRLFFNANQDLGVRTAAVSPDGRMCVWGTNKHDDNRMMHWELEKQKMVSEHKVKRGSINRLVFSRAGDFFVSLSGDGIKKWDTGTGAELRHFSGPAQQTQCMALSPNGKLLATGGMDGTVFLWDVPTGNFREQLLKEKGFRRPVSCATAVTFASRRAHGSTRSCANGSLRAHRAIRDMGESGAFKSYPMTMSSAPASR